MFGIVNLLIGLFALTVYAAPTDLNSRVLPPLWLATVITGIYPLVAGIVARLGTLAIRRLAAFVRRRHAALDAPPPSDPKGLARLRPRLSHAVSAVLAGCWLVLMGGHVGVVYFLHWPARMALQLQDGSQPNPWLVVTCGLVPFCAALITIALGQRDLEVAEGSAPASLREVIERRLRHIAVPLLIAMPVFVVEELLHGVTSIREALHLHPSLQFVGILVLLPALLSLAPLVLRGLFPWQPLPDGPLRHRFEQLAKASSTPCRDFLVWQVGRLPLLTACVAGPFPRLRYIFLTDALVRTLSHQQLEAVVAHELAHARRGHMLLYLAWAALFLAILGLMVSSDMRPEAIGAAVAASASDASAADLDWLDQMSALASLAGLIIGWWFLAFGWLSRRVELDADREGARLVGSAAPLCQALEQIIALSGGRRDRKGWRHPSVAQRVELLVRHERDPQLEQRFGRQLALASSLVLVALLGAVCSLGWMLRLELARPLHQKLLVAGWSQLNADATSATDYLSRSVELHDTAVTRLCLVELASRQGDRSSAAKHLAAARAVLSTPPLRAEDRPHAAALRRVCQSLTAQLGD